MRGPPKNGNGARAGAEAHDRQAEPSAASAAAPDPLALTVRELLERLLAAPAVDADPWIDLRGKAWPWRRIVADAERGEVRVSRIGRRLLMRRSELDRWLESHAVEPATPKAKTPTAPSSPVAHLLERAGYTRADKS